LRQFWAIVSTVGYHYGGRDAIGIDGHAAIPGQRCTELSADPAARRGFSLPAPARPHDAGHIQQPYLPICPTMPVWQGRLSVVPNSVARAGRSSIFVLFLAIVVAWVAAIYIARF
jgi:hypothetical protein